MPIFEKCHLPIEVSGSTTEHAIKNETWTFSNSKKYEITKEFFLSNIRTAEKISKAFVFLSTELSFYFKKYISLTKM